MVDEPTTAGLLPKILAEVQGINDRLARIEAEQARILGRVHLCIDALGAFRRDYLREHPRPEGDKIG
jgi:hypothetical protein